MDSLILHKKSGNSGHTAHNMRAIKKIRNSISGEIFNYTQVIEALREYSKPRDVIGNLLKHGDINRVKKGLYIFDKFWRKDELDPELLANLIYGPSLVSLEYILATSGLIPEDVFTITSITTGRPRSFDTPVGRFTYQHLNKEMFSYGIELHSTNNGSYLAANPLKALADKIWLDKRFNPTSPPTFADYLFDDLRIDDNVLIQYIDEEDLNEMNRVYSARKIRFFTEFLKREFVPV